MLMLAAVMSWAIWEERFKNFYEQAKNDVFNCLGGFDSIQ